MAKKKQTKLSVELIRQMLTLATSGFGLVAALAWNSLIQTLVNNYIKKFLPGGSDLISLFIYALIVTFIAVIVTVELSRVVERLDLIEDEEKLEQVREAVEKDEEDNKKNKEK